MSTTFEQNKGFRSQIQKIHGQQNIQSTTNLLRYNENENNNKQNSFFDKTEIENGMKSQESKYRSLSQINPKKNQQQYIFSQRGGKQSNLGIFKNQKSQRNNQSSEYFILGELDDHQKQKKLTFNTTLTNLRNTSKDSGRNIASPFGQNKGTKYQNYKSNSNLKKDSLDNNNFIYSNRPSSRNNNTNTNTNSSSIYKSLYPKNLGSTNYQDEGKSQESTHFQSSNAFLEQNGSKRNSNQLQSNNNYLQLPKIPGSQDQQNHQEITQKTLSDFGSPIVSQKDKLSKYLNQNKSDESLDSEKLHESYIYETEKKKKEMFDYFNQNFSKEQLEMKEIQREEDKEDRVYFNNLLENEDDLNLSNKKYVENTINRIAQGSLNQKDNLINQYKQFDVLKEFRNYTQQDSVTPYHTMLEQAMSQKKLPLKYKFESLNNEGSQSDLSQISDIEDNETSRNNNTIQTLSLNKTKLSSTYIFGQTDNKRISLQHYRLGDNDAKIASQGLALQGDVEQLDLKNNLIADDGAVTLVSQLNQQVRELNLSNNQITFKAAQSIAGCLNTIHSKVRILNLEGNKLGDIGIKTLFQNLDHTCRLTSLNISSNNITSDSMLSLRNFLIANDQLVELYMHWNMITATGGQELCKGLDENTSLKVLDVSFNSLGRYNQPFEKCSGNWAKILKKDYMLDLVHLDLSYNKFNKEECLVFAEAFKYNHTIFGLHFDGNVGKIDAWGFLQIKEIQKKEEKKGQINEIHETNITKLKKANEKKEKESKNTLTPEERKLLPRNSISFSQDNPANSLQKKNTHHQESHQSDKEFIVQGIGEGDKYVDKNSDFLLHKYQRINSIQYHERANHVNCWICEGWHEKHFTYTNYDSGPSTPNEPFIHFNIDGYTPHKMKRVDSETFEYYFMCPPDRHVGFFFSVLGNQILASNYERINSEEPQVTISFKDTDLTLEMRQMNTIHIPSREIIMSDQYQSTVKSQPRYDEENIYLPQKEVIIEEWKFENSIFRTYKKDNEALLNKCFEEDWGRTKLEKFIKDEDEKIEIKKYLKKNYHIFKNLYKYYASQRPMQDVWSITSNVFTDFMNNAGVIDGLGITLNTLDFNFIVTNSAPKTAIRTPEQALQARLNPERSLIRYQMMEIMTRLADEKYLKPEIEENLLKSLQAFVGEISEFQAECVQDEQDWRDRIYWCEKNDNCLKYYKPIVQNLYNMFAGLNKKKITNVVSMSLVDLQQMVRTTQIMSTYKDSLKERDILFAFNLSTMTNVNEYTKDRHLELNFVEFLECISRIADACNPYPFQAQQEDQKQNNNNNKEQSNKKEEMNDSEDIKREKLWSLERRRSMPLHIKIEGLLTHIYKVMWEGKKVTKEMQDFEIPEQSLFDVEVYKISQMRSNELGTLRLQLKNKMDEQGFAKYKEKKNLQNQKRKTQFFTSLKNNTNSKSVTNLKRQSFLSKFLPMQKNQGRRDSKQANNDSSIDSRRSSKLSNDSGGSRKPSIFGSDKKQNNNSNNSSGKKAGGFFSSLNLKKQQQNSFSNSPQQQQRAIMNVSGNQAPKSKSSTSLFQKRYSQAAPVGGLFQSALSARNQKKNSTDQTAIRGNSKSTGVLGIQQFQQQQIEEAKKKNSFTIRKNPSEISVKKRDSQLSSKKRDSQFSESDISLASPGNDISDQSDSDSDNSSPTGITSLKVIDSNNSKQQQQEQRPSKSGNLATLLSKIQEDDEAEGNSPLLKNKQARQQQKQNQNSTKSENVINLQKK